MIASMFRYPLQDRQFTLELRVGSRPRKILIQDKEYRLWIELNKSTHITLQYDFRFFFDGEDFDSTKWTYIDSTIWNGGFAAHLYWRPSK